MKSKIAAAVLAAVLLLHVCGDFTRARASGAVAGIAAIAQIGIMAFHLLSEMIEHSSEISDGINSGINSISDNIDSISDTEDMIGFVSSATAGSSFVFGAWKLITETCSDWFDSGEITISDDGKVRMKYSQYLDLCDLVGNAYAETDVQLVTDIPYILFKADRDVLYLVNESIIYGSISDLADYSSYSYAFYTDDKIYFPDCNVTFFMKSSSNGATNKFIRVERDNFSTGRLLEYKIVNDGVADKYSVDEYLSAINMQIGGNESQLLFSYRSDYRSPTSAQNSVNYSVNWYCYDGHSFYADTPDLSNTSMALLHCKGSYIDFINSIASFQASSVPVEIDDLSDPLANVLTKTTDPTLEIDTDPSIVSPDDAVKVTDIPGEGDSTLSQLKEKTKTDIDIPSVIADKFPFCIPFDFIRIISILCADPKAPVFHIPISTDPENLQPFEGNQTIGEYPEDFKPMFEIDEEIVIDLSCIPLVQPICYTIFILGFVILLIFITPKMINH